MNVLKIGGGRGINNAPVLENLARRVNAGEQWVVVHGCSAMADQLAHERGVAVQTITHPGGYTSRYTDAQMIQIFANAASLVNSEICHLLPNAVGMLNVISAQRKTAIRAIRNGRQMVIRDDFSGTITGIQSERILSALQACCTPVIAPLGTGETGERLNIDGDLVAATVARVLRAENLIILSNVRGLLRDVHDPESLIPVIPHFQLDQYEGFAVGRMKKKLLAAQEAKIRRVIIADARVQNPLDAALNGGGTHVA